MPKNIGDIKYFSVTETAREIGCSRTTLWRWLKAGVIPPGRKYRNLERLFTLNELALIRGYSMRMEGEVKEEIGQLTLFPGVQPKGRP